jgi:hypothetical protein
VLAESYTGVPLEWLFGVIATLIALVYMDIRRAVWRLQKGATFRDRVLVLICDKLKIDFKPGD